MDAIRPDHDSRTDAPAPHKPTAEELLLLLGALWAAFGRAFLLAAGAFLLELLMILAVILVLSYGLVFVVFP